MRIWVWVTLAFAPVSWALEFGVPNVVSAADAPLEVRIPVTEMGPIDASQLFPMLAPESAFLENGVTREQTLSQLRYVIENSATGTQLVIRSLNPWQGSELTTLVEVFTPEGARLVPVSVNLPVVPAVVPERATKTTVAVTSEPTVATPKPSPAVKVEAPRTLTVGNGSTLWRLAARVKPEGVSMEQVILALFDTNPDAFEYGNINALEKGTKLVVPSLAQMQVLDPVEAKVQFDAHMREPKRNFWGDTEVTSVEAAKIDPTPVEVTPAPVAPLVAPEVTDTPVAIGPDVDALLEKIAVLETKLDQVDAKLEVLTSQRPLVVAPAEDAALSADSGPSPVVNPAPAVPPPAEPVLAKPDTPSVLPTPTPTPVPASAPADAVNVESVMSLITSLDVQALFDQAAAMVQARWPDSEEWRTFWKTELGQGTAIFLVVVLLVALMRKVYGGATVAPQPEHAPMRAPVFVDELPPADATVLANDVARVTGPQASDETMDPLEPILPEPSHAQNEDALESAIAKLKSKIEDPTRLYEAEALYQEGDDALIDAFSADALNENPEWGQDPDDEADVATHQLELARNYLDMGMTQTAIELLQRVAVSPHQASAQAAKALLDARGR